MGKINFKKWALHFTIWILIINIISFCLTINYVDFPNIENNTGRALFYFEIITSILLILTVIFIVMSSVKKEKRNYQYWVSITGLFLFGLLPLIASYFS